MVLYSSSSKYTYKRSCIHSPWRYETTRTFIRLSSHGFQYHSLFPISPKATKYRKLDIDGTHFRVFRSKCSLYIKCHHELTKAAITDVSSAQNQSSSQLRHILDDETASPNDHFVAKQLLMNATVIAIMILPSCQDTGTAIVMGKKGQQVFTLNDDTEAIYMRV